MSNDISGSLDQIYSDVSLRLEAKINQSKQDIHKTKKKLLLWLNWIAAAFVISLPLTLLIDELIYIFDPGFYVYSLPGQAQWLWALLLFLFSFFGLFMARAGWALQQWIVSKFF